MTSSFAGFGMLLFSLPVLVGQWVGILGLGKTDRNAAWWCMAAGVTCSTLGNIVSTSIVGMMMAGGSGAYYASPWMTASGLTSRTGALVFAIGFAIHGLQASKVRQRVSELEAIAAAQGEELNRQRPSY